MSGITPRLGSLTLMVTDQCNLSCRYCYLGKNRKDPGRGATIAPAAVDLAVELAARGARPFYVLISGGEPFLAPGQVAYAAREIRKAVPSASMGIQTNGTRLDRAAIDLIREFDLRPKVSLDGDPPVQESLRGKASDTFKGLALLEKHLIPFDVTAVVSSANVEHLHRLVMVVGGMAMAREIGLDLLVAKGRALKDSLVPAPPARIQAGIRKMRQALSMVNHGRSIPLVLRELEKIREQGTGFTPFCRAAQGLSLAVTPDGHLFPCTQTAYDPRFFLGSLDRPGSWQRAGLLKPHGLGRVLNLDAGTACRDCPLDGRCPGECPSRLYYNRDRGTNAVCSLYRALAEPDDFFSRQGV